MTDKINYLFCPLAKNCEVYSKWKVNLSVAGYDTIIYGIKNYACLAIGLNKTDNQNNKAECALIKLLNQTKK
ncbi:MAG: hypothetical protein Q8O84_01195 [Nanoarchaeota archaeon]|nr:hypothetical protein [Nanoarchaeota archaeon]